jgi:LysM repeat protein
MITLKDIFKPSFFTLIAGVLIVGYLLGYSFGSNKLLQSNTTYVQAEIEENHIEKSPEKATSSSIITIQKGDTLWKIAQVHFPNYPIDDVIYYLKTLNQLESDSIQAGDKLRLS